MAHKNPADSNNSTRRTGFVCALRRAVSSTLVVCLFPADIHQAGCRNSENGFTLRHICHNYLGLNGLNGITASSAGL